jgi:hypothetical protein
MLMANLNAILDVGQVFGKGHQFPAMLMANLNAILDVIRVQFEKNAIPNPVK